MFLDPLFFVCFFTFLIHFSETIVYGMRLSGVRTKQIAIAMSFVTSSLLVSRLSNMFQAPLVGAMVDSTILDGSLVALDLLANDFRIIIFYGFIGSLLGALFTPTTVFLFQKAIQRFLQHGSIIKLIGSAFKPKNLLKIIMSFKLPPLSGLKSITLSPLPKLFLFLNIFVTAIYSIGVLCSLMAGALLPDLRSTAIQLSGIINGLATIMMTLFVDPSGARVTDQAVHNKRPESHIISVVFFLQMGRLIGTLIIAQLFFGPFTGYIKEVTLFLAKFMVTQ